MPVAELTHLYLGGFKSFRNAHLPLDAVTVLTGRNSSGKSNALDALEVLSRLATGEDIADALDGRRREGGAVRGGSRGCAPHGSASFSIGCRVRLDGSVYSFYVEVVVEPELRIVHEELFGPAPAVKSGKVENGALVYADEPVEAGISAELHNGKQGANPRTTFRDSRLVLTQVPLRLSPKTSADRAVVRGCEAVTAALRGVFHLDPVPHLMREYVPRRDSELRRTGENLSATLGRLQNDEPSVAHRLRELVDAVADHQIADLVVTESDLGDVMLAAREAGAGQSPGTTGSQELTPARELSDGLLRFLAVVTAMLTPSSRLDIDQGPAASTVEGSVHLVIEEIENGLHPSQATTMLRIIQQVAGELGKRVLVTTHSPALLNVMTGRLNKSVLVCYRDQSTGRSSLARMPDLPGYVDALAKGPLGDAVTRNLLTRPVDESGDPDEFSRLLGIDRPA